MFQIIDDILPPELAQNLYKHCINLRWSYNWHSNQKLTNYKHWNSDLTSGKVYNTLDITNRLQGNSAVSIAWQIIKNKYLPEHKLIRCYANSYTFGAEGYPHTDSIRKDDITTILYITNEWPREWGGETVIYDGNNIVSSTLPSYNRALMLNSNLWHCARGVTRMCDRLRTVLVFKSTLIGADPIRDKLQIFLQQIGADKLPHNKGYLIDHLLNIYDYLRVTNQSESVCLAGGLHSIFGTNIYNNQCLNEENLDPVISLAGTYAVELIRLFGTLDRPKVLEEYLNQTDKNTQYDDLCLIEAANLADQNALSKYPKLNQLWNTVFKPCLPK